MLEKGEERDQWMAERTLCVNVKSWGVHSSCPPLLSLLQPDSKPWPQSSSDLSIMVWGGWDKAAADEGIMASSQLHWGRN